MALPPTTDLVITEELSVAHQRDWFGRCKQLAAELEELVGCCPHTAPMS